MSRSRIASMLALAATLCSCGKAEKTAPQAAGEHDESWSVTAWGEHFEVFPELEPLVVGRVARANTHVTVLKDFSALAQGKLALVLTDSRGQEAVFEQPAPKRPGIFVVDVKPAREGIFELAFRIRSATAGEEISAGRVRVGTAASPGGLEERPKPPHGTRTNPTGGMSFLKEQQWRTEFATAWATEGSLAASVWGPARVVPHAGGEVVLTAPVDAVVAPEPWPYTGQRTEKERAVFRLVPRVVDSRSLPELEADVASLEAETEATRRRAERMADLLKLEAVSHAEAERVRATLAGLEARLLAARRDLATASAARRGESTQATLSVRAPWEGRVADVMTSPGQAVASGTPLARLVKARPVWLDVALRPEDAARLTGAPRGLFLKRPSHREPLALGPGAVRLVSKAPEIDTKTGTTSALLEIDIGVAELPVGSFVEAEVLMPGEIRGLVIPATALVDDGGTAVAYEQLGGESFARHEVRVRARQGGFVLVEGVQPGARLVTRGGAALRRAALLSSGPPEGHVH